MNQSEIVRDRALLRTGAASAVLGVVMALVQSGINPMYPDDPTEAIEQLSKSHFLTFSRVLDMTAFLLMLVGVTIITRAFSAGRGATWARISRTLFTVSATAGAIATMVVGSFPDIAQGWVGAAPALKPGYVAVYDALNDVSGGIFAVSWASLGSYGLVYAVAVSRSELFSRKLAWISAASGLSLIGAIVVGIGFQVPVAFVLLLLGLLLSYVVIVVSAIKLWRLPGAIEQATRRSASAIGQF
jgi:hypothetical protein